MYWKVNEGVEEWMNDCRVSEYVEEKIIDLIIITVVSVSLCFFE